MAAKKELTQDEVVTAFRKANVELFKERSGFPLSQAQRNLEGRSHYVTDGTMKAFNAKVHTAAVLDEGLLFGIVESVKMDENSPRIYRPVFFDLFGNVVAKPEDKDAPTTERKAQALFWEMADELEALDLNLKGIKERQKVLQAEIDELDELAKTVR